LAVGMQLGLITHYEIVLQEKYTCTSVSGYVALVQLQSTHRQPKTAVDARRSGGDSAKSAGNGVLPR